MFSVKVSNIDLDNLPSYLEEYRKNWEAPIDWKERVEYPYFVVKPISEFMDKKEVEIHAKIPENYKDRLYIEYKELEDRSNKLSSMLEKWRNNSLDFTPSCSYELLEKQLHVMLEYKRILEERAEIEKISLEGSSRFCVNLSVP